MTTQDLSNAEQKRTKPSAQLDDERARKRVAIGLAPRRPTAKAAPQRPPDEHTGVLQRWWTVWLLLAVTAATVLLLFAKVLDSPTDWSPVQRNLATWWVGQKPASNATTYAYQ